MSLGFEILGAVKVRDGIFVGDEHAAQDLEFVVSNKVTHIVNTSGRQIPNHWETIGVVYLTYHWVDNDSQVILDNRDIVANEFFSFIDEAVSAYESVLIHSARGQSRSCCVLAAYLMRKYHWGLRKTLEFVSYRRPDLNLKPAFMSQLSGYERRLAAASNVPFSMDWSDNSGGNLHSEELLLRNTFLNSQINPIVEMHGPLGPRTRRLTWSDSETDDRSRLETPAQNGGVVLRVDADGRPVTKSIIKKFGGDKMVLPPDRKVVHHVEGTGVASRPTTAGSVEASISPPCDGDVFDRSEAYRDVCVTPIESRRTAHCSASNLILASQRGVSPGVRRDSVHLRAGTPGRDPSPRPPDRESSRELSLGLARGESPIRLLQKPVRTCSMAGPACGIGLSQRSLTRPTPGITPGCNLSRNAPGGMSAFRSGGPVKARADAIGADAFPSAPSLNASLRRNARQISQPGFRKQSSRPASPAGQKQGSRQSSPSSRPCSPSKGPAQPLTVKQRNLSQHMRRAPSPTPMALRDAPRPRWRM